MVSCRLPAVLFLVVFIPSIVVAQSPVQPPPYSGPGSSSCDSSEGYYIPCGHSLSMASIVALVCVSVFFFLLLCWCLTRLYTAARPFRPLPSLSSFCRRSSPQIHLHLHPTDSPSSSVPASPHPSSSALYPFRGHYRIGQNQHLSTCHLLLHFDASAYPRTLTGHGMDESTPFVLANGLFTVDGGEYRCTFTERFDDGSRYQFSGVGSEGVDSTWKGHWWKEGGDQAGVWSMKPDDDRWTEMQRRAQEMETGGERVEGAAVDMRLAAPRVRTEPIQRLDLEERKEVGDVQAVVEEARETRMTPTPMSGPPAGQVDVEMTALRPPPSPRIDHPLPSVEVRVEA